MSTPWTRRSVRRPLAARAAAPREPADHARIGRRVVRRRATGMWERIEHLLVGAAPSTVYDPGADVVVQEELATEAAAAAREADLREAQREHRQ